MSNPAAAEIIERLGVGAGQIKAMLAGGGVWLADGAELLLLSSITRAVAGEWQLEPWQKGMVVSIVFFGCLVGNLMSGVCGDTYGRRFPLICSYIGIFVFSMLSVAATGFYSLCFIRFFVGVSFGLAQPAYNTYIGEITPSTYRLKTNALSQVLFVVGELYSAILIWMQDPHMRELNWRTLVILGAIPSLIFLILAVFMLEESPSFLMVNFRRAEAQQVLKRLRDSNGATDVDVTLPEPLDNTRRRTSLTIKEKINVVLGPRMLYSTVVVCISVFTFNFLFYGGLYSFPQVLPSMHLPVSPSVDLMLGAMMELPGYLLAVVLGQYLPRKTCMFFYLIAVLSSILIFSFAGRRILEAQILVLPPPPHGLQLLVQFAFLGHKIFTAALNLVVYVYSVEIYPTVARTTGASLCIAAGRLGAMTAPSVFEHLRYFTGGYTAFFNTTALICAINAALVLFLPYETKDTILQDHLDEHEPILEAKPL